MHDTDAMNDLRARRFVGPLVGRILHAAQPDGVTLRSTEAHLSARGVKPSGRSSIERVASGEVPLPSLAWLVAVMEHAGAQAVARAFAEWAGGDFVPKDGAGGHDGPLLHGLSAALTALSDVQGEIVTALADGKLDADELVTIRAKVDDLDAAVGSLRVRVARAGRGAA